MHIDDYLLKARQNNGSDIHIAVGAPVIIRIDGELKGASSEILTEETAELLTKQVLNENQMKHLREVGEVDCSYETPELGRFRVNAFLQKNTCAIALRAINTDIPDINSLGLPEVIKSLTKKRRGLILVTGPTGSGKSTTLASMIGDINAKTSEHIITIEDPIEYMHNHKKSIINQREVGDDTDSFANALRASLREDPDIILVGEMRDLETIQTALTAAETGHLVLSTLHTIGAAKTVDRIIDVFPPHQQQQVRVQLGSVLEAVISQQLLPKVGGGRVGVHEIMISNHAIKNLIREGKTPQMQTIIQTSAGDGMQTMDSSLIKAYGQGKITREDCLKYAVDANYVANEIQ